MTIYLCTHDETLRALLTADLARHGAAPVACAAPGDMLRAPDAAAGILLCGAESLSAAAAAALAGAGAKLLVMAPRGDTLPSHASAFPVIAQPFKLGALLDRIDALRAMPGRGRISIGPYMLDPDESLLADESRDFAIRLTEKERDILIRLHAANGAIVGREELLDEIWGYGQDIETHTLETHIYRLRRKIEDDPARPLLLTTEEKGYRLRLS